jgi:hypothetical protein
MVAGIAATLALILTVSVGPGTAGECSTPEMTGAISAAVVELAAPGVPPTAFPALQLWPFPGSMEGLTSSSALPVPSASATHSQPGWPLTETRVRFAQSPSVEYLTEVSMVTPSAATICTVSPEFESDPVHGPNTLDAGMPE